jgi:hypothetical protein
VTAAALAAFQTLAHTTRTAVFGQTIRVAGEELTAVFSAPRLVAQFAPSTVRDDTYTSTVRILKSDVEDITRPNQWIGVLIELPEGTGWRSFRAIPELIMDVRLASEWRLEVESIGDVFTAGDATFTYYRPDGVSRYLRPDGVSTYLRP